MPMVTSRPPPDQTGSLAELLRDGANAPLRTEVTVERVGLERWRALAPLTLPGAWDFFVDCHWPIVANGLFDSPVNVDVGRTANLRVAWVGMDDAR